MFFKIDSIEICGSRLVHTEQLKAAKACGSCTLSQWQLVLHFTKSGKILEENDYPLFGCKNYDKNKFRRCVPQGNDYQTVPCPILTKHLGDIKLQIVIYLIENGLIDKNSSEQDSLVRQAIIITNSKQG